MKILVTGGAGFIGSHLAERLFSEGHDVTILDSLSDFLYPKEVKMSNIHDLTSNGVRFKHLDLATSDLSEVLHNQQVVINQAAIPGLEKSWSHLSNYVDSNLIGLGRLLDASVEAGVERFIQISTSSVYGRDATGPEESQKNPVSPYGVTKLSAEALAKAYEVNFGLQLTILRYFSVYGPRQRPDMAYYKFINAIINDEILYVYGDGHQSRSNTFVSDVVTATLASINLVECPVSRVFNVAGTQNYELLEVISILESIIGKKARLKYLPTRNGDQKKTSGVTDKAHKYLNWRPEIDLESGLERQIDWQKKFSL
jgi:nucleoside-diphosphate-sugar epimerase